MHQFPRATADHCEGTEAFACRAQHMEAGHEGRPQATTALGGVRQECSSEDPGIPHFVMQAVHQRLDRDLASRYNAMGSRYEAAFLSLFREQARRCAEVEDQLSARTESYRLLHRESFLLRHQVEAMTQHIFAHRQRMVSQQLPQQPSLAYMLPPPEVSQQLPQPPSLAYMPPPPGLEAVRPSSPSLAEQAGGSYRTAATQAEVMPEQQTAPSPLKTPTGLHNPWATYSPQKGHLPDSEGDVANELRIILAAKQHCQQLQHAAAALSPSVVGSESPLRCSTPPTSIENPNGSRSSTPSTECDVSFNITLRRSDDMPLGIEVQPNANRKFLAIERILPGSVVDAWNRQCAGELREIRPGDRVISVNGFEDVELMRSECVNKRLLKLALVRPGATEDSISELEDEDASA